jgi:hypothetical protein
MKGSEKTWTMVVRQEVERQQKLMLNNTEVTCHGREIIQVNEK